MKDGKVAHQGTFEDIEEEQPDVYSGFKKAMQMVTESETETEAEQEQHVRQERMLLQRQVSKQLLEEEGRKRAVTLLESGK